MPRGTPSIILSALKVLMRMKHKRLLKVHPPNVRWGRLFVVFSIVCGRLSFYVRRFLNRTTILIPFLQAIKHFCNFIPSYFMKRFAFLIDDTSYIMFCVRAALKVSGTKSASKLSSHLSILKTFQRCLIMKNCWLFL